MRKIFSAGKATRKQTDATIAEMHQRAGYLLDPHTAVGVHVSKRFEKPNAPMITLATAHPAKFPDAVKSASGIDPALPSWLSDLMVREERFDKLQPDLDVIETYIARNAGAAKLTRNKI